MAHSFLLEAGNWIIQGYLLKRNEGAIAVRGQTAVVWKQDNWFTISTRLILDANTEPEIQYKYRGHLDSNKKYYTYVLKHSVLGNIEGEGWIGQQSIIQCYWVVGATQRHTGFDTYYRLNEHTYHLSSAILAGHRVGSTMEATLKRQT